MAERLNDRRVQLAAFLKLGMYHVIDMVKLAPIWAEYIKVSVTINASTCMYVYTHA